MPMFKPQYWYLGAKKYKNKKTKQLFGSLFFFFYKCNIYYREYQSCLWKLHVKLHDVCYTRHKISIYSRNQSTIQSCEWHTKKESITILISDCLNNFYIAVKFISSSHLARSPVKLILIQVELPVKRNENSKNSNVTSRKLLWQKR